jgi:hypothetical protein
MLYPAEIVRERFLYDSGAPQRQYEVTWSPSVTSKHKSVTFQRSRVERIVKESSDGKHALVEWRSTWEKADAWDEDKAQAELVNVWREYCAEHTSRLRCPHQAPTKRSLRNLRRPTSQSLSQSKEMKKRSVCDLYSEFLSMMSCVVFRARRAARASAKQLRLRTQEIQKFLRIPLSQASASLAPPNARSVN